MGPFPNYYITILEATVCLPLLFRSQSSCSGRKREVAVVANYWCILSRLNPDRKLWVAVLKSGMLPTNLHIVCLWDQALLCIPGDICFLMLFQLCCSKSFVFWLCFESTPSHVRISDIFVTIQLL